MNRLELGFGIGLALLISFGASLIYFLPMIGINSDASLGVAIIISGIWGLAWINFVGSHIDKKSESDSK